MANIEKANSKSLSKEVIGTLTVFSHINAYGMLSVVIKKSRTESLCL